MVYSFLSRYPAHIHLFVLRTKIISIVSTNMNCFGSIVLLWCCLVHCDFATAATANNGTQKMPTVMFVMLFRNKAHTMPYVLNYLNRLDYPKDRISFWIRSDHNEDNTLDVLINWLASSANAYHNVNIEYDRMRKRRINETSPLHWPTERHLDVIRLKEEGLQYARASWADYVLFLDADVFLTNPATLRDLIALNEPIASPMLTSEGLYSNFWCGMTADYYYQRTQQYQQIYNFELRGQFHVPMVHSAVLINLNDKRSDRLTFCKTILSERFSLSAREMERIPVDDIILFALSANYSAVPLTITNSKSYGYVTVPLDQDDELHKDDAQVTNVKIMSLNEHGVDALHLPRELEQFVEYPTADKMSMDAIFMINLERRSERRVKMERSFREIGLEVENVPAVDGQTLTDESLEEIGVKFLPGYADPFSNRPMTKGEIGCFLSHFWIWEKMRMEKLNEILVLEDDIRFEPYFKERAMGLLDEARHIGGWDLIYFGRKKLVDQEENWIGNSQQLVHAGYSYWTLGYALSQSGAQKLLDARPLDNLIPVDEFLPVMFDRHINESWKAAFPNRNLIAWSASPLLLFPTTYTGEDGYFSDTEESDLISMKEDDDQAEKNENNEEQSDVGVKDLSACAENGTVDANFMIKQVNERATITHSSEHSEL